MQKLTHQRSLQSNTSCRKNLLKNSEFERNCKVLQEQFTKRGYDSSSIETQIKKIKLLDQKDLLTPKTTEKVHVLPLTVTYNRTLPNMKQTIQNHCSILKINKVLEKTFSVEPKA